VAVAQSMLEKLQELNVLLEQTQATIAMLKMMQGDTRMSEDEWAFRNRQVQLAFDQLTEAKEALERVMEAQGRGSAN
jgi:hypothetical protein